MSLTDSLTESIKSWIQDHDEQYDPQDVLRIIQQQASLLFQTESCRTALLLDDLGVFKDVDPEERKRLIDLIEVVDYSSVRTLQGYCRIDAVVRIKADERIKQANGSSKENNDTATNTAVQNFVELKFCYEKECHTTTAIASDEDDDDDHDTSTTTTATVTYTVEMSADYTGPRQKCLHLQVFSANPYPNSHVKPVNIMAELMAANDDDMMDALMCCEDGNGACCASENNEHDDAQAKTKAESSKDNTKSCCDGKDSSCCASNNSKKTTVSSKISRNKQCNDDNDSMDDGDDECCEENLEQPSKRAKLDQGDGNTDTDTTSTAGTSASNNEFDPDKYVAEVHVETIESLIGMLHLNKAFKTDNPDDAIDAMALTLLTFPFYEHEYDIVGMLLYMNNNDDDEEGSAGSDEC